MLVPSPPFSLMTTICRSSSASAGAVLLTTASQSITPSAGRISDSGIIICAPDCSTCTLCRKASMAASAMPARRIFCSIKTKSLIPTRKYTPPSPAWQSKNDTPAPVFPEKKRTPRPQAGRGAG